jgi:2-succinyl-6-hydroxy-2,4-cyclohexadiene-1-carboxylate synthase
MTDRHSPLLFVHGFTGNAEVWNDVISALTNSCSCIALDLPGHGGQTDVRRRDAFTFNGACTILNNALDEAAIRRANIWGYSMGGRIALHFALAHPERVAGLILESASPGIADHEERLRRLQSDEDLAASIESRGLEDFVDRWMDQPLFAPQQSLLSERQELGRRLRLQNSAAGLAVALRGFSVGRQEPLHNRLAELTMPTLVIAGEWDHKYREIGETMVHSIPNAQFRIIPGSGHAPHWEQPFETAAVVGEFLSKAG